MELSHFRFVIPDSPQLEECARLLRDSARWSRMFPDGWACTDKEFAQHMLTSNRPFLCLYEEEIAGLFWLHDFEGRTCQISYFALLMLPRGFDRLFRSVVKLSIARYRLAAVFGHIAGSNRAALGIARRVGFREVLRIRSGAADGSDLVYVMFQEG